MTKPDAPAAAGPTTGDRTADALDRTPGAMLELEKPGASNLPFRVLLTVGLMVAAVLPLAVFGIVVMLAGWESNERAVISLFAFAVAGAAFFGLLAAYLVVGALTAPLRRITTAVERVAAGEPSPPIHLSGDDELARLAESHNRIAADVQRRNAELAALLAAIAGYDPSAGSGPLWWPRPSATPARYTA